MPVWINALLFAILVVTIPFMLILRILMQLPKAQALSHKRWSPILNFMIIGAITAYVAVFIRNVYYTRPSSPIAFFLEFLIAAVAYGFGLALILRQFSGIYPEYLVTTGAAGLGIRKIAYQNIEDVEEVWRGKGETRLRIHTVYGSSFLFSVPTRSVPMLHENLKSLQPPE
jgi:hypothetical protein